MIMNMDKFMTPIQIVYTANKAAWLPALVTSLSSLSTVAVFSSSLDCRCEAHQIITRILEMVMSKNKLDISTSSLNVFTQLFCSS